MARKKRTQRLYVQRLEERAVPAVTTQIVGSTLLVSGDAGRERIVISQDSATNQLVVTDHGLEVGRFASASVQTIQVSVVGDENSVRVRPDVMQQTVLLGGDGKNLLQAGGGPSVQFGGSDNDKLIGGPSADFLNGGPGRDLLAAGPGIADTLDGGAGADKLVGVKAVDSIAFDPDDQFTLASDPGVDPLAINPAVSAADSATINAGQVGSLLNYASAVTSSNDAIIAIVDRNGRILGVRVESGVDPAITGNPEKLTFAIDGAVAEARTGAFFANNQAPLTSRTIEFISQSTITQREVDADPNIPDPNSPLRGPGFVAPVHIGGHFPPGIANTPQVDLFAIQNTNRDSIVSPGPDRIRGTPDDITLSDRFNIDPNFVPAGQTLFPPESYGRVSGLFPNAQSRGIGTLPGGIPLYFNGALVGGIGVFFPGKTGFATEENSSLSTTFDPTKPDRSLEAEYIAFMTAGGAPALGFPATPVGGLAPVAGFSLPLTPDNQRIDLVGVTLDIIGPGGTQGPARLVQYGQAIGQGLANGTNVPVTTGGTPKDADGMLLPPNATLLDGKAAPEGWLVLPHDGVGVTAAEANAIIQQGFQQAAITRAAIRLPLDSTTRMVFAVSDLQGNIVALFRMPDATVFSIDVAVAKSRNVSYYANPAQLLPIDNPGVPVGTAFTNRTIRYLAEPFFPEGIDGSPPGPYSVLNDGGTDPTTGLTIGPPLPASAFQSVLGFDSFNPQSNFHQAAFYQNQDGIVFFPGSAPLYRDAPDLNTGVLIGGFGVSGDGVDEDDVVTFAGARFNGVPNALFRADETFVRGIRLPYQKFNRQPLAN
jgi:uncharacterized protein GlcG (DUF336 family)